VLDIPTCSNQCGLSKPWYSTWNWHLPIHCTLLAFYVSIFLEADDLVTREALELALLVVQK
jgi:hypothetical protein